MYKRLLLTYVDKYARLDMEMLSKELNMTEQQIVDIAYTLKEQDYFEIKDGRYLVTNKGKRWVFPWWNDWSAYKTDNDEKPEAEFFWDYLYIPENML